MCSISTIQPVNQLFKTSGQLAIAIDQPLERIKPSKYTINRMRAKLNYRRPKVNYTRPIVKRVVTAPYKPLKLELTGCPLVLFTTYDGDVSKAHLRLQLFKDMSDIYHAHNKSQSIYFTKTPEIAQFFEGSSVIVSSNYAVNKYNLPIITSLYKEASKLVKGDYYGYINSEIIIENSIFDMISYINDKIEKGIYHPQIAFAGHVYQIIEKKAPTSFLTLSNITDFFIQNAYAEKRNDNSADYFVFTKAALPWITDETTEIVVGRKQFEDYVLGVTVDKLKTDSIIDTSRFVRGVHVGKNHLYKLYKKREKEDLQWNQNLIKTKNLTTLALNKKNMLRVLYRSQVCCILTRISSIVCLDNLIIKSKK